VKRECKDLKDGVDLRLKLSDYREYQELIEKNLNNILKKNAKYEKA
jgi:hypothetical protein